MYRATCFCLLLAPHWLGPRLLWAQVPAGPGDWPQWRGPLRDGVSRETGLLKEWSMDGPPVAWEVEHVGPGYSSVAVQGDRLLTMGSLEGVDRVLCLSTEDGSLVWAAELKSAARRRERQVAAALAAMDADQDGAVSQDEAQGELAAPKFAELDASADGVLSSAELHGAYGTFRDEMGAGPRGTPTIDDDRVYALSGQGDLGCLDVTSGRTIWSCNLLDDFGGQHTGRGYSESPLVDGERLIVSPGGPLGAVMALDKWTGRLVWRSSEVTEGINYASAVAADIGGTRMIVQFASQGLFGLDARDGRLLWRYNRVSSGVANVCTPIVVDNLVFAASAYGTGGGLARIVRQRDGWRAEEVYFNRRLANHHGGVVRVGDHLYGFGSTSLFCLNFLTGKVAWVNRSVGKGSLVAADGMLYLVGEAHRAAVAEATPEAYREHGRLELAQLGRPTWSHPVVAGGRLYIRNQQRLTAYDVSARPGR